MDRISFGIKQSRVSELVRVSTGCVPSSTMVGEFWYLETWIFSKDPRVGTSQVIHTTISGERAPLNDENSFWFNKARKVHDHIVRNLRKLCRG